MNSDFTQLIEFIKTLAFQASSPSDEIVWGGSVSQFAIVDSLPGGISPCEPLGVSHGYTGEGAWYSYIEIRPHGDKFIVLSYCEFE